MDNKVSIDGTWERQFDFDMRSRAFFTVTSDRYTVRVSGGSVRVCDRATGEELARFKGYNYLYTGDIKPDESELFALENGKHFYIFSLKEMRQTHRITLPKTYRCMDMYGEYSEDGKTLYVPVCRITGSDGEHEYHYYVCEYETDGYTLRRMTPVEEEAAHHWPLPPQQPETL